MSHWDEARAKPHYPGCPTARKQIEPCVGVARWKPSACQCGYGERLRLALVADREDESWNEPIDDLKWLRGILQDSEVRGN